jgi:CHAD domain-containing protein
MSVSAGSRPLTPATLRLGATPIAAGPADGVATHVRATLDTQLRALLAHQHNVARDDEPEAVHQMRVAGRRIRVALRIAGPVFGPDGERARAEVAWLGGLLGPVRDLDVLCGRLEARAGELDEIDRDGFGEVLDALRAARSGGRDAVTTALTGTRYRTLLRALAKLTQPAPDAPNPDAPADLVRRPARKLARQVERAGKDPTDLELHELRIRGKRLRYAADFGAALGGRREAQRLRVVARAAKNFQDVLGNHQDTVAAEHRLRELALGAGLSSGALLVLGRLVEREHLERAEYRARWWSAWRALRHAARALG